MRLKRLSGAVNAVRKNFFLQHLPPIFFRPNSTVGITREFVKRTGAHFSNELSLLPLDILWAMGDDRMFADLLEIASRGENR